MVLVCPLCDVIFKDGDEVVAEVVTHYKHLASKKTYAVDKNITECLGIIHRGCRTDDMEDLNDPNR